MSFTGRIINPTLAADLCNPGTTLGTEIHGWYPTLADTPNDWIGSRNGTYVGNAATVADVAGCGSRAYEFDGTGDHIDGGAGTTAPSTVLSITCWAYSADWTQVGMLVSQYKSAFSRRKFYLAVVNDKLRALVSNMGVAVTYRDSTSSLLTDSTWHFFGMVYNATGSVLDVYVDAVKVNGTLTGTVPASIYNSDAKIMLGDRVDLDAPYTGRIDDARIHNAALSAGQMTTLYNGGGRGY